MTEISFESASTQAAIIVGTFPGQPDTVLTQAAEFAARFGAALVCVFVDQTRYVIARNADATVLSASMNPDVFDDEAVAFPSELMEHIRHLLDSHDVSWVARVSAGDPADSLSAVAEVVDALAIVVGTHRASARQAVAEFFNGAVAVHLAHRQHRPVIVIPVTPAGRSGPAESPAWMHI